jgi:hypothetical protein
VNPSSFKPTFYTWKNASTSVPTTSNHTYVFPLILVFISLDLIDTVFFLPAAFPGSGHIPPPIPAMHDAGDDPYQDVLCRIPTHINCRCIPSYFRKGRWSLSILGPIVSCSHMYIQDISQTAQMHVLYTRFRGISAPLSPLLSELEGRANAHPEELSALLAECHSTLFQC